MNPGEAQLLQGVYDERVSRADGIAIACDLSQGAKVKMIGMSMGNDQSVYRRETFQVHLSSRAGHYSSPFKGIAEHGIHQADCALDLDQDGSVPQERNLHLTFRAGVRPTPICSQGLVRSRAPPERTTVVEATESYANRRYGYFKIVLHALDWMLQGAYVLRRLDQMESYPICPHKGPCKLIATGIDAG